MYEAFLSFGQINEYLDNLIRLGMLEKNPHDAKRYRITEKGSKFLRLIEEMDSLLKHGWPQKVHISTLKLLRGRV